MERLKWPLWANVVATIGLTVSIITSGGYGVWTVSRWINTFENQIAVNQTDVIRAAADIAVLKENIVSLDGRANQLKERMTELHALSDQADAALKARLDVMDALAKFTAERAMQPNLPLPQGPRR
jgi:hypothetical protein